MGQMQVYYVEIILDMLLIFMRQNGIYCLRGAWEGFLAQQLVLGQLRLFPYFPNQANVIKHPYIEYCISVLLIIGTVTINQYKIQAVVFASVWFYFMYDRIDGSMEML